MDASILMTEGLTLMGFGMGFVFVFLTLLVIATRIMSWVINRYESNIDFPSSTNIVAAAPVATPVKDESLITVLTAAVHKHRSRHKN